VQQRLLSGGMEDQKSWLYQPQPGFVDQRYQRLWKGCPGCCVFKVNNAMDIAG
jgi:hypothetical protein